MPVSLTTIFTCDVVLRRRRTSMLPPRGVNLTAFDRRFHTTCCKTAVVARHGRRAVPERALQVNTLCVGGRLHRRDRIFDDRGHVGGLHFQPRLAEHDARDVEHVLDNLRQRGGIAIDHFERLRNFLVAMAPDCSIRA